jgi:branched-chain amino acid transport system substrate-binding protein
MPFQRKFSDLVLPVGLAAALWSCATGVKPPVRSQPGLRTPPVFSTAPISQQERAALLEVQLAYSRGAYSDVMDKALAFESRFPRSSRIPEVLNLRGLALLLTRRPSDAAAVFRMAIERTPDAFAGDRNWKNYVRYNRSAALLESGSPKLALDELAGVEPENFDPVNRVKFFQLKARAYEQLGDLLSAAGQWIALSKQGPEVDLGQVPMESSFEAVLARMRDLDSLEANLENSEKSSLEHLASFYLIRKELDENREEQAKERMASFLVSFPSSSKLDEITEWMSSRREAGGASNLAIGLLIPQTGRFARVGQKVLQSASLALGIYGSAGPGEGNARIQLVVEDCGEDPDSALRALERLHRRHRVAAVIGPILSKGADLVVQKAEDYGLPLVSLAQQAAAFGEFSSQAAVTPRLQASEIARHAIQGMGLRRFAILAPRDRFGEEYSQEFWNAVEALGGTITAYERYEPGETDFRSSMDRLAGTYYSDARRRELEALAKDRETNQIKRRTRRTEKFFALPPVVNFEAVFIPDEPKAVGLALPTFTYRDIDGVKFLGISSWNSPELLQRAQASAEGAVFVDSYFPLAEQAIVRRFAERFRTAFGQEAGSIEAVAFDAAVLVERAVSAEARDSGVDRTAVAARIRQLNDVPGVTGKITVRDGQWQRNLKVLTIRDSQVAEAGRVEPARGRPARAAD